MPAAIVDARQAIVPAFPQPLAQVMDVPAHEREPHQHRCQDQSPQELDSVRIEWCRLLCRETDHECIRAHDERADQQKGARPEA